MTTSHATPARRAATWWLWALIAILLLQASLGVAPALGLALILATGQAGLAFARSRSLHHFPTQVRVVYALWMIAAAAFGVAPMIWLQAAGTFSLVLLGYCPLARTLMLLPVNRNAPLSLSLVKRILLSPPVPGSFREALRL